MHNFGVTLKRFLSILLLPIFLLTACARNVEVRAAPLPESSLVSESAIEPAPTNECLSCHRDQQRLIDTAKPEEVQVKESSGTG
jgi:hypothetical protein